LNRDEGGQDPVGLYCFSSGIDRNDRAAVIDSIEDLFAGFKDPLRFSNFLFISSKVFRTRAFQDRTRLAYHYCYSVAPHFAVALSMLKEGVKLAYESEWIVDWKQPAEGQKWSSNLVAAGLPTLSEIHGASKPVLDHLAAGLELMLWKPFLRGGIDYILFDEDRGVHYWYLMVLRLLPFLKGKRRISAVFLLILSGMVVAFPLTRGALRIVFGGFRIRMPDQDLKNDRN
jgi:hypothetical protein